jgi:hypothetical protein
MSLVVDGSDSVEEFYPCLDDSDDELFDCVEEFAVDLELGLQKVQDKEKSLKYLYFKNIDSLNREFQAFPGRFAIVLESPAVAIWVDPFLNTLTYFDPKGKLAAKYGIDLDLLKGFLLAPQGKVIQLRDKDGHNGHLHTEQACLNFIYRKLRKVETPNLEEIPILDCAKVDSIPVFNPYGPVKREHTAVERIQDYVNSRTILSGAMKKWDPERIKQGKLTAYTKIGGEAISLRTPTGDVNGCYFNAAEFHKQLQKMGGKPVEMSLSAKLPILQNALPIQVMFGEDGHADGVKIAYHPDFAHFYEDLTELKTLCEKQGLVILDTNLQPIQEPERGIFSYFSRPANPYLQDLILVKPYVLGKAGKAFKIVQQETFYPSFQLFSPQATKVVAVRFQDGAAQVQSLFENLQIDKTNYRLMELNGALYLTSVIHDELFYTASLCGPEQLEIKETQLPQKSMAGAGVVLLTMNQTSSYFQYPHEILSLLFEGVSVMAYDNYQKGLSSGTNSEEGIYQAIEASYRYLRDIQNYQDQQILAKGQCAGGPPTSQLGANHPMIHIWIDQAPASYSGMVGSLFKTYAQVGLEKYKEGILGSAWFRETIVNSSSIPLVVAGVLPHFDVAKNLRKNKGAQLFTIGIPNHEGKGGDKLVPSKQQDEIMLAVSQNANASYLPMIGGEHITDWWKTSEASGVVSFLKKQSIAKDSLLGGG